MLETTNISTNRRGIVLARENSTCEKCSKMDSASKREACIRSSRKPTLWQVCARPPVSLPRRLCAGAPSRGSPCWRLRSGDLHPESRLLQGAGPVFRARVKYTSHRCSPPTPPRDCGVPLRSWGRQGATCTRAHRGPVAGSRPMCERRAQCRGCRQGHCSTTGPLTPSERASLCCQEHVWFVSRAPAHPDPTLCERCPSPLPFSQALGILS